MSVNPENFIPHSPAILGKAVPIEFEGGPTDILGTEWKVPLSIGAIIGDVNTNGYISLAAPIFSSINISSILTSNINLSGHIISTSTINNTLVRHKNLNGSISNISINQATLDRLVDLYGVINSKSIIESILHKFVQDINLQSGNFIINIYFNNCTIENVYIQNA